MGELVSPQTDPAIVSAHFRKRMAGWALWMQFLIILGGFIRADDLGNNITELLIWVAMGNVIVLVTVVGAKGAIEALLTLKRTPK